MPKIKYQDIAIGEARLAIIKQANAIIAQYRAQGFTLTLRQLYYQFVARDLIPNTMRSYKNLGNVINDGRMAGLIDWSAIEDRTRNLETIGSWDAPSDLIDAAAQQYKIDLWLTQPYYVEVWIEKDALAGVIEPICRELRVPYFSCRGYTSQSEMWGAGRRLMHVMRGTTPHSLGRVNSSRQPVILHLGDHDPSGIDMSRDIEDRLRVFSEGSPDIRRIALNMDQVEQYNPPPNFAKITDSRARGYMAIHGNESWELDALEPPVLAALIREQVDSVVDADAWNEALERERKERGQLAAIYGRYADVIEFLEVE